MNSANDGPDTSPDVDVLRARLAELKTEHRDMDDVIAQLIENTPFNQLQIQRMKKRKLALKDQIQRLEDQIFPDIIA